MSFSIKNKTALITGAGKRIGRAAAIRLGAEGANIIIHYNTSRREAEEVAKLIRIQGREAWIIHADLAKPESAEELISRAAESAGPVDILVNNASIFPKSLLNTFTPDDLFRNININALSPFLISRSFSQQGREGVVINMLDAAVVDYDRRHAAYHVSKRILLTLTRMAALEYAPKVRVNGVAPGLILPPEGEDESYLRKLAPSNPLNRWGSPEGIADAVVFLAKSDFITGQVIFVDGGRFMKGDVYAL
ncbi:MAG: SDR family oxidoreductase [Desulfobacterales bacterium]|nr:SDR family oxidoreductase [Desulfobacterales bacterium]